MKTSVKYYQYRNRRTRPVVEVLKCLEEKLSYSIFFTTNFFYYLSLLFQISKSGSTCTCQYIAYYATDSELTLMFCKPKLNSLASPSKNQCQKCYESWYV